MNKERGSIWRRWDLHLHTPGTLKQNLLDSQVSAKINDYCKLIIAIQNLEDEIKKEGHVDTFRTTVKGLESERATLASVINISDEELNNYTKLEKELQELET